MHFGLIEEALLDDEEVKISFPVRFQNAAALVDEAGKENPKLLKWRHTNGYYAFALTNLNRLIYAHWQPFHHISESLKFNRITDVKIATKIFLGYARVGTLEDDFYLYFFSKTMKRIGKILQTVALEQKIMPIYDEADENLETPGDEPDKTNEISSTSEYSEANDAEDWTFEPPHTSAYSAALSDYQASLFAAEEFSDSADTYDYEDDNYAESDWENFDDNDSYDDNDNEFYDSQSDENNEK